METTEKTLRMRYTYQEIADLLEVHPQTLRNEIKANEELSKKLSEMGLNPFKRPLKKHVIEIFKVFGFPSGYEHYEQK